MLGQFVRKKTQDTCHTECRWTKRNKLTRLDNVVIKTNADKKNNEQIQTIKIMMTILDYVVM